MASRLAWSVAWLSLAQSFAPPSYTHTHTPAVRLYCTDAAALIPLQLDLLRQATTVSLAALYARDGDQCLLVAQSPASTALPRLATEQTLSAIALDRTRPQPSFSVPVLQNQRLFGYVVVIRAEDVALRPSDLQVLDHVVSTIAGLQQIRSERVVTSTGSGHKDSDKMTLLDHCNSNLVTMRTFLKMLSKRLPKDDYIGVELVENTFVQADSLALNLAALRPSSDYAYDWQKTQFMADELLAEDYDKDVVEATLIPAYASTGRMNASLGGGGPSIGTLYRIRNELIATVIPEEFWATDKEETVLHMDGEDGAADDGTTHPS